MTDKGVRFARRRHWRRCAPVAMVAALGLLSCENEDAAGPSPPPPGPSPPPPLPTSVDSDRAVLVALYESTDGPNWVDNENWLTDAPLGDWRGVGTYPSGRVSSLTLRSKGLSGTIPPEIGDLGTLAYLDLNGNKLTGPIPAELGRLASLGTLSLRGNDLDGPIPAELGRLASLTYLDLSENALSGPIPSELGDLAGLTHLHLWSNNLTGTIPPELGNLSNLRLLVLSGNGLTGDVPSSLGELSQLENLTLHSNRLGGTIPSTFGNLQNLKTLYLGFNTLGGWIPRELGRLVNLEYLFLQNNLLTGKISHELGGLSRLRVLDIRVNNLTGAIPVEVGNLSRLQRIELSQNQLTGSIPAELGRLSALQHLDLTRNRDMRGVLPATLTALGQLNTLLLAGTGLCAPREPGFLDWLGGLDARQVTPCGAVEGSFAYVTQAVQSVDFPVPLVAGDDGLLRVFVRADQSTSQSLPDVRASFFLDGTEVHVVDIPAQSAPIPTGIEEGDLARSANARIPGSVLQPGLEMVVEIDPGATLDSALGVTGRIPEKGRAEVDVRAVPAFALTVIPFLAASDPDSSILEFTRDLNAGSGLLRDVNALLPVARLDVNVHEPVLAPTIELHSVLGYTDGIRIMEGAGGYHLGLAPGTGNLRGVAVLGGFSSSSIPVADVIAHEIGHNLNLPHAPCGGASGPDPSFPQRDGSIGAWGFDSPNDVLVPPSARDLMSYCYPHWISGYNFAKMLTHRVNLARAAATAAPPQRSLLLWGGVDEEESLFLDPALVVDAPAVLPSSAGAYRLSGVAADGRELFSLDFDMSAVADGDGRTSFAFALPADPAWSDALARITLSGPEGSATLDRESDRPIAILLDPASQRVRGILRPPAGGELTASAAAEAAGNLEVLYSRGIPDAAAWRR
ncbi:leucine-rich repeat domain-containing protein [Candidatus Palauibacter sp.]|uniref:leucine-rich repeat domain-containing protein n=1 Tax=Candidatus Palauibacter sp. TaxID=3101350 RepID=UPI003B52366A